MKVLRCQDKDCHSHKDGNHAFDVTITVDEDGDGNSRGINGELHSCCHCQEPAVWVDVK